MACMSIAQAVDSWITGRLSRQEINQNTADGYRYATMDFIRFVGPETEVGSIEPTDIERWLARPRLNGRPYTAQSLNTRSNPIRAFFRWAAANRLVEWNPMESVGRAKVGKRLPKGLSENETKRLLYGAGMRDRTIILVGLHLGLRRAEIANMEVPHWDRRDNVLYVVGKGNKERTLPVEGELKAALEFWVAIGLGRRTGPFWPSNHRNEGQLSVEHVGRVVKRVADEVEVAATTHSLRHTCASDLVRCGAPTPVVQAWLGHENIATTSLYVVSQSSELRRFADLRHYLPEGLEVPTVA